MYFFKFFPHEIGFREMFFDSLDEAQGCMEL